MVAQQVFRKMCTKRSRGFHSPRLVENVCETICPSAWTPCRGVSAQPQLVCGPWQVPSYTSAWHERAETPMRRGLLGVLAQASFKRSPPPFACNATFCAACETGHLYRSMWKWSRSSGGLHPIAECYFAKLLRNFWKWSRSSGKSLPQSQLRTCISPGGRERARHRARTYARNRAV